MGAQTASPAPIMSRSSTAAPWSSPVRVPVIAGPRPTPVEGSGRIRPGGMLFLSQPTRGGDPRANRNPSKLDENGADEPGYRAEVPDVWRPTMFLLCLIAALAGTPLRQAEAAGDLARSL